eukprot:scaffold270876_cov31-Tisochrysis_lutea.AAC.1
MGSLDRNGSAEGSHPSDRVPGTGRRLPHALCRQSASPGRVCCVFPALPEAASGEGRVGVTALARVERGTWGPQGLLLEIFLSRSRSIEYGTGSI